MQPEKKRLLLFSDWFDPAYKAGGPIQSAVNFVKQMKNDYEIFVLTSDRDLNGTQPMASICTDQWHEYSPEVMIFYASIQNLRLANIKAQITAIKPDVLYLNSMFSKSFSIYPLWLKRFENISPTIVLAPRGMLKSSALDFKKMKKRIFLSLLKWMKIPQLVTFHATDEREKTDVVKEFGKQTKVAIVANFPSTQNELYLPQQKKSGSLDILFIGRIHPIKGLEVLLKAVKNLQQRITVTIVGNVEDIHYALQCRKHIKEMPENVKVDLVNELPHYAIQQIIRDHHILCLPTKGENFGHAIFESLAAGRPVLISDQTPWRHLIELKAGWDVPLSEPSQFTEIIEQCALMNEDQFNQWCRGAWEFCNNYLQKTDIKRQYFKLFS